jgi:hypothetical protein
MTQHIRELCSESIKLTEQIDGIAARRLFMCPFLNGNHTEEDERCLLNDERKALRDQQFVLLEKVQKTLEEYRDHIEKRIAYELTHQ